MVPCFIKKLKVSKLQNKSLWKVMESLSPNEQLETLLCHPGVLVCSDCITKAKLQDVVRIYEIYILLWNTDYLLQWNVICAMMAYNRSAPPPPHFQECLSVSWSLGIVYIRQRWAGIVKWSFVLKETCQSPGGSSYFSAFGSDTFFTVTSKTGSDLLPLKN